MTKTKQGRPKCPECGKPASGNFCQSCGAQLGGRFCNKCGAELSGSAKFCNQCGATAAGGKRGGGQHKEAAAAAFGGNNLPWWIAGAAMFGLIVVVGTSMVRSEGPSLPPESGAPGAATGAAPGPVDLTQMSPQEAADRLYARVMTAAEAGDSAAAQQFLPMALQAYDMVGALDNDGLFHLSLLQRVGLQQEEARATAERILASNPNHLLGLLAAAEAANELGDTDAAVGYYQRILDAYDQEMASPLQEYLDHGTLTQPLKAQAEAFLAGR